MVHLIGSGAKGRDGLTTSRGVRTAIPFLGQHHIPHRERPLGAIKKNMDFMSSQHGLETGYLLQGL